VLLTIVGTLGAVGGATAAAARGAGLWSPPALPSGEAPRRGRRLVAVSRVDAAPSDVREAPDPRAAADPASSAAVPGSGAARAVRVADAEDDGAGGGTVVVRRANGEDAPPLDAAPRAAAAGDGPVAVREEAPPEPTVREELARLAERLEGQGAVLAERLEALARDVGSAREEERQRQAAVDARQEAALERLRAEVAAGLAARDAALAARDERLTRLRLGERRAEAAAELYGRLARLEAAVAAVTNPILLPGEPYAPPAEFLPDALAWENWKDVGERAFAFADQFNTQRLLLGAPARDEVAAFVTELRGVLTSSVYPNLRPDAGDAQLAALRSALDRLAARLPQVRERLAGEYRAAAGLPEVARDGTKLGGEG